MFFLLISISLNAFAQLTVMTDVSKKFSSEPPEASVRSELLFDASMQAVSKIAPELGFSSQIFDQKLAVKFSEHFNNFKNRKLSEKFGPNYRESLSENDRKDFLIVLEFERQDQFVKFSRTLESVRSYTFKQFSKDEADSKSWKAKIELNLDKTKLLRNYRRIINDESKPYSKILIHPEVTLTNMCWNDLGLEGAESFTAPLRLSWLKWIEENLPSTVEEAQSCLKECVAFWNSWSEISKDEALTKVPLEYANAVWLKLDITMKKTEFSADLSQLGLEWSGRVVLLDVNTKRIISTFELGSERRNFRGENQQAVNSAMASSVYRSPLSAFVQISKSLQDKLGLNRLSRLVIRGHKQLNDALVLVEKLKTRGASLGLEVHLDTFTRDEAQLICYYRGEEKSFSDLLSGLKELKSSQSYTLVNEFTGVHHVLKLVTE